jgi:selenocysteine lyase/cysteine desulfurase
VEVRVVQSAAWALDPAAVAAAVDARTRVISVSHVSYLSGARLALEPLRAAADRAGALLVVDATQSAGVVPVPAGVADIVLASSYKWLLGAHGLGIVAVDPARTAALEPPLVGWRAVSDMFSEQRFERFSWWPDARRWELAFPAYPALYMLRASLRFLLELEIERIEAHVLALGDRLIDGLEAQGRTVMTPRLGAARAGSVAFVAPDGAELSARLQEAGVLGWGGDGRMRFSLHAFNGAADVDRALATLERVA